jgi:hypothetical protein
MKLRELDIDVVKRIDPPFLAGGTTLDVEDLITDFDRDLQVDDAITVVRLAMDASDATHPAQSDAWLGPRLHAALRLTRREAARRGVWRFLGVVAIPEYVRWRWTTIREDKVVPPRLERFVGPDYKQALARLWWMAELFRDGSDYGPAERALRNQDITNNLFRMDVAHHRPTVQGAVAVLGANSDDEEASGRVANALAKAVNTTATTLLLDVVAPDAPLDDDARSRWIAEARDYDPGRYFDELPEGPSDPAVPATSVATMRDLLYELLDEAPVRGRP